MKTTRATLKKFIREGFAKNSLFIQNESSFNGMIDCVDTSCATGIEKAQKTERSERYTLGVHGAWFVGDNRDHYVPIEKEGFTGYEVSNCCGSFLLLTK